MNQLLLTTIIATIKSDSDWTPAHVMGLHGNLYVYDTKGVQRMIIPAEWAISMYIHYQNHEQRHRTGP